MREVELGGGKFPGNVTVQLVQSCLCLKNSGQEMVSDASEISPAVAFCLLSHRKRITALTHTS